MSFYKALLRFYPSSFRSEYGPELVRTFEDSVRHRGRFTATFAALFDVVPNALLAHGRILLQDLRYAFRTLRRSPGFALTVVLITALGVGANTATFSVADFVLLRPLPFPEPDRLVRLCEGPKEGGGWGCMNELSPANFRDVAAMSTRFSAWGAFTGNAVNLVGPSGPVRVSGMRVTAQIFPLLGIAPLMGRWFDSTSSKGDDTQAVLLSYPLWQTQFGSDQRVLGQTIRLDGNPYTVIGIMPRGFHFPDASVQLWLPLVLTATDFENRGNTYLYGIGRLGPGATFEQGQAELGVIFDRMSKENPESNAETGFSYFRQRDYVFPRFRIMLLALCGASLSLLLLTSANLANLLLARAAIRERELAVRAAMGAGRDRLIRQMLTESLLLAILGGLTGIAVAAAAVPLLSHMVPNTLPIAAEPALDLRALGFAAAFTAFIGIGFGLLPALRVGGRTGFAALREGARGSSQRQRLRTVLVTGEVALSVALLISSGFLIRAMMRVESVDPGFVSENVLTMRTALPSPAYDDSVRRPEFYRRVLSEVRALPGVQSAAYISGLPMIMWGGITGVEVPGQEVRSGRRDGVSWRLITPQYFSSMGIPVLSGRDFQDSDAPGRPLVTIVSQSFVTRYWPDRNPIGLSFTVQGSNRVVVGVVGDVRVRGLERTNEPQVYLPSNQFPAGVGEFYSPKDLVIRTNAPTGTLLPAVRDIIRRVDPEQPVSDVRLLSEVVTQQTATRRAQLQVLGALALVALLLTGVGIHGLLAFLVAQRAREIGVRLALGAEPSRVARMIVGEASRWALIGCLVGGGLAYAAARSMQALLFGLGPGDPATFAVGVGVIAVVTLAGALIPALRAVRISPQVAMRAE